MSIVAKKTIGFTIVELLIVIVVIAILAAITIVVFSGIQDRAHGASLRSDLSQARKQLMADQVINGSYPANTGDANDGKGLTSSDGNAYHYSVDNAISPATFCLGEVNGDTAYHITEASSEPTVGVCPGYTGSGDGGESAVTCSSLSIGDTGPAGGVIFYKDGNTCYEAAKAGWYGGSDDPQAEWGCYPITVSGADGTAVGTGQQNTADIVAANCSPNTAGNLVAAVVASNYNGGGKSDWYLPSTVEAERMYDQKDAIGGLAYFYWTSTEYSSNIAAWTRGNEAYHKYDLFPVRPIRSFSD